MPKLSAKMKMALWGLIALNLALVAWVGLIVPRMEESAAGTLGQGDYQLTMTDGSVFTEDTLKGSPSAVFFGFTHCPDVCPTTLGDVSAWQEDIADVGELRVFFVTVDPERDTADLLAEYVGWAPGVSGVTGAPEEMAKAIKSFGIFARKVDESNGGYTMDHTASVLLFDAGGQFVETIRYQEDHDLAVQKIRALMTGA
ncbi:MAG: SCO family protein [Silicimonas sp.]|nr:SCO family protein [Silicimonas sp.]